MFGKNFKKEPTEKQKIGQIGEGLACRYLEKNGYRVIERNYLKKWGEIDIVAKKAKKIHFVEVKSVSRDLSGGVIRETNKSVVTAQMDAVRGGKGNGRGGVKYYGDENVAFSNKEMHHFGSYRAEDNMHQWKLQRLGRAIQSYLLDRDIPDDIDWQFDVVTVYIDSNKGLHNVSLLEDVIL